MPDDFRTIRAEKVVETMMLLHRRIGERFPDRGLTKVARSLLDVAEAHVKTVVGIRRPNLLLRAFVLLLLIAGVAIMAYLFLTWKGDRLPWNLRTGPDLVELVANALASLVLLSAAVAFLLSLERRHKRSRAFKAIHELRSIAHIVDMHQLTKDPDRLLREAASRKTLSSPGLDLTPFELRRYLDYCGELLSLIAKIGALYVQSFPDPEALDAVDAVEDLTTGLSRKIWQKILIIYRLEGEFAG